MAGEAPLRSSVFLYENQAAMVLALVANQVYPSSAAGGQHSPLLILTSRSLVSNAIRSPLNPAKHAGLDHAIGVGKHHAPGNPGYLTAIEVCLYGVSVARPAQSSPSATPARKTPAKASAKSRAEVRWEGDSREVLCGWSPATRTDFGIALEEMQEGRPANLEVRAMPSIGKDVYKLQTNDEAKWYGLMYLARVDNVIHVLDCFEKNTRKAGIKDLDRSLSRLKRIQDRLLEKRKNAK